MEGRTALRLATHAAILNSRGLSRTLLTTVERELTAAIAGPAPTSMESALENWRTATALIGGSPLETSPHLAVAIASTQIELLRRSRDLLSVVDINPQIPGSPDRLRSSIEANIQAWSKAADRWYDMSLTTVAHDAAHTTTHRLALAATELSTALTDCLPPGRQLDALVRTGFGGNLVAGIVASGRAQLNHSVVVPTACSLEMVAAHFTEHRYGPPFRDRTTSPSPDHPALVDDSPTAIHIPSVTATLPHHDKDPSDTAVTAPHAVPVRWLTRQEENELAQRRDAGTIAQAALDGDPTARNLAANATQTELQALALAGRGAVAQLVAAMIPTMQSTNRWIARDERADALQSAAVDVAAAAGRWDPAKGARWLSFAWSTSWWASTDSRKAIDVRPIPLDVDLDRTGTRLQTEPPGPEQALLEHLEASEQRHLLHQIRALQGDEIRSELLTVVLEYHGLTGEAPKTFAEIAHERDSSTSTIVRRYREGIRALRRAVPASPTTSEPKPWRRPEHTPHRQDSTPRR
ncbi:hypothetical protein EAX62_15415 [Tessaracoccus antarcticus]|uniref:Uncharacterized protein n=2 Tax=Tessaracoccus antarcticus TaxID=2479848 RepID=A0A3M0FYQ0_9ACTN|nr:hypothetical protein EAX62_15415 [Tessaracoccus antarcticus]